MGNIALVWIGAALACLGLLVLLLQLTEVP